MPDEQRGPSGDRGLYDLTLVVGGLDPTAAAFETSLFDAGLPDGTIAFQRGAVLICIAVEADTLIEDVTAAMTAVARVGGVVRRIEPDPLVTLSDIAERAGLTRAAVSQYAAGHRGDGAFPAPVARVTADSPLYEWSVVAEWLCRHGVLDDDAVGLARAVVEANGRLSGASALSCVAAHRAAE